MRLTAQTSTDNVIEQSFDLDGIPGLLWTPADATGPRPLILLGHGGGQHKRAPGMLGRAHRFVAGGGFAVACVDAPNHGDRPRDEALHQLAARNEERVDAGEQLSAVIADFQALVAQQTVPELRAVLTALQELDQVGPGPAGYWGVSLGGGLGIPFVAAEPRVRAAVLGMTPGTRLVEAAASITVPVQFLVQWDDERVPRQQSLALFEALACTEKTMHANPGGHGDLPRLEIDSALHFFRRHLLP